MSITLEDILREFTPQQRAEIDRDARKIVLQNQTIAQLRVGLNLTQAQFAKALSVSQASVAEMEGRDDMMVSTVGRIVRAMGGEIEIVAKLPNKALVALRLGKGSRSRKNGAAKKPGSPASPRIKKTRKAETRAGRSENR